MHTPLSNTYELPLGVVQSSYSTCTTTQCNKLKETPTNLHMCLHPLLQRAMSQEGVSTLGGELSHWDKKYYTHKLWDSSVTVLPRQQWVGNYASTQWLMGNYAGNQRLVGNYEHDRHTHLHLVHLWDTQSSCSPSQVHSIDAALSRAGHTKWEPGT